VIKVLIVDDSRGTLDSLQKLLSFEPDIEVVGTALNGEEAITRARELRPNVVLMDFNMPVLDGIEATRVLAEEAPRFPVIMMSVQGDREYLHRAMRSGASEFLMKPFSGDELVASLHRRPPAARGEASPPSRFGWAVSGTRRRIGPTG